jgi:membrane-associated phospholipid phosphatase
MKRDQKPSRHLQSVFIFLTAVTLGAICPGCGTMPSGRAWGENAIYPVEWKRIPQAAKSAALDPVTWLPLVGAGVIAAGDWDHNISDWAIEHTPIFGSKSGAEDYSDVARDVLLAEGFATALLTPGGNDAGHWFWNKTRGVAVGAGAVALTDFATSELKDAFGRERPNGKDGSMPSGHSSSAFAGMALANRNLDYIEMNRYARTGLKAANVAVAASVAWARVEGEKHFPTDVLVGAALGNFTTRFIYDAFIGTKPDDHFSFYVEPSLSGGKLFLSWDF